MVKTFEYPAQSAEIEQYKKDNPAHHEWHDKTVVHISTGEDIPADNQGDDQ